jgi:hypothetical protein
MFLSSFIANSKLPASSRYISPSFTICDKKMFYTNSLCIPVMLLFVKVHLELLNTEPDSKMPGGLNESENSWLVEFSQRE